MVQYLAKVLQLNLYGWMISIVVDLKIGSLSAIIHLWEYTTVGITRTSGSPALPVSKIFRNYHYFISVVSTDDAYPPPTGDIRLVGGVNSFEGRVEIFVNGTWGTVCQGHFGHEDAAIVCRQLGLEASSM